MRRICALLLIIFGLSAVLTACGGNSSSSLSPPPVSSSLADSTAGTDYVSPYEVEITKVTLILDDNGKPAVVIDYKFTNNSSERISSDDALMVSVYQDTWLDETTVERSEYDVSNNLAEIRPNDSIESRYIFILDNTYNYIEVEFEDWDAPAGELILYQEFDIDEMINEIGDLSGFNADNSDSNNSESGEDITTSIDWKTFLEEYETWVDDYIVLVEKYVDNPTDMTILTDYTEMTQEMLEWTEQVGEMEIDLEDDPAALAEYVKELTRISNKLNEAVALLA